MSLYDYLLKVKRAPKPFGIQKALNIMHYDPKKVLLTMEAVDYVVLDDGSKFHMSDQIDSLQRIADNPWFDGIKPDDIVLDIGANIGAITIPMARKAKKVIAIEPLFDIQLLSNVILNDLNNVMVYSWAMSKDEALPEIAFSSARGRALGVPFESIKQIAECWAQSPITVLKVDCEGAEWDIEPSPELLEHVRELRFEFHVRRSHRKSDMAKLEKWRQYLHGHQYSYEMSPGDEPPPFHEIVACYLLNAHR